jgi:hypothetical protein
VFGLRAIALAESLDFTETLVDALITVGVARLSVANDQGREQLERAFQLATRAGLDDPAARAIANLGFGYDEQYRFDRAECHFTAGIAFCVEHDLDHFRHHMTAWLAQCRLMRGDLTQGRKPAASVLRSPDIAPVTRFVALLIEVTIRLRRGEDDAEPLLDEALAIASASGRFYRLGPIRFARAEAVWIAADRQRAVAGLPQHSSPGVSR